MNTELSLEALEEFQFEICENMAFELFFHSFHPIN
jgi:hypothetical protein